MLNLYGGAKITSKAAVEKQAEKENQEQTEDEDDLPSQEQEKAMRGAYKRFVVLRLSKADIDDYFDQVKLYVKALIESQLNEIQSTKVIKTLWVKWKKPVKSTITLDPEDVEGAQDLESTEKYSSNLKGYLTA